MSILFISCFFSVICSNCLWFRFGLCHFFFLCDGTVLYFCMCCQQFFSGI